MKSLTIAVTYAQNRRQFTKNFQTPSPDNAEIQLIRYATHYTSLMPLVAKSVVLCNVLHVLKEESIKEFNDNKNTITKNIHLMTSGMKILCSEHCVQTCETSGFLCGGHGYSDYNEISRMHKDSAVFCTFEGDNCVLRQELCKDLLKKFNIKYNNEDVTNKVVLHNHINPYNLNNESDLLDLLKNCKLCLCYKIIKDMTKRLVDKTEINASHKFNAYNLSLTKIIKLADVVMYEKITKIYIDNVMKGQTNLQYPPELLNKFLILFVQNFILNNYELFAGYQLISPQQLIDVRTSHDDSCATLSLDSQEIVRGFGLPKFCTDNLPMLNKKILISRL